MKRRRAGTYGVKRARGRNGIYGGNLDENHRFYTSPGFADEIVHLFLAEGLSPLEEKRELDEDEFVEVMQVTLEEAVKLIESRRVYDAKRRTRFSISS